MNDIRIKRFIPIESHPKGRHQTLAVLIGPDDSEWVMSCHKPTAREMMVFDKSKEGK